MLFDDRGNELRGKRRMIVILVEPVFPRKALLFSTPSVLCQRERENMVVIV